MEKIKLGLRISFRTSYLLGIGFGIASIFCLFLWPVTVAFVGFSLLAGAAYLFMNYKYPKPRVSIAIREFLNSPEFIEHEEKKEKQKKSDLQEKVDLLKETNQASMEFIENLKESKKSLEEYHREAQPYIESLENKVQVLQNRITAYESIRRNSTPFNLFQPTAGNQQEEQKPDTDNISKRNNNVD